MEGEEKYAMLVMEEETAKSFTRVKMMMGRGGMRTTMPVPGKDVEEGEEKEEWMWLMY